MSNETRAFLIGLAALFCFFAFILGVHADPIFVKFEFFIAAVFAVIVLAPWNEK